MNDRLRHVAFNYTDEYKSELPSVADHDYYHFIAKEFREFFAVAVSENRSSILRMESHSAAICGIKFAPTPNVWRPRTG